jgi:disulfide bond formation protein DsbB
MAERMAVDRSLAYQSGSTALFLAAASILVALGFQYIGGYYPCPLCFMQRYAFYFAIPALFAALALSSGGERNGAMMLFGLVALAFLANAALGVYHAGAEWKFWPGPDTCVGAQAVSTAADSLIKELETTRVVRCDEASIRIFGLSFAGWNVIASLIIAGLSARAATAVRERF